MERIDEKPPPLCGDKGSGNEHRDSHRDTGALCGLLVGSRQVGLGAIRVACLRLGEQRAITGMALAHKV